MSSYHAGAEGRPKPGRAAGPRHRAANRVARLRAADREVASADGAEPAGRRRARDGCRRRRRQGEQWSRTAYSDETARVYRSETARRSDLKAPTIPVSNRPGWCRLVGSVSSRAVRSRSAMASSASAVVLSRRLSGNVSSHAAYSACSASSSTTASRQRWGRLRRSAERLVRAMAAAGCVMQRARWRAWRSALLSACSPSGLRPLGMALFSVTVTHCSRVFIRRPAACAGFRP